MSHRQQEPHLNREAITGRIGALPGTGSTALVSEQAAAAACFDIRQIHPILARHIGEQVTALTAQILPELDGPDDSGNYTISPMQLRGAVAKAVLRATAQIALDIGGALQEISSLEGLLDGEKEAPE
jgi:hypothetical protein